MPFLLIAMLRCENPLLSSHLTTNKVSPLGNNVAPGLKTVLISYGQSFAVKIGFDGCLCSKVTFTDFSSIISYEFITTNFV